MQGVTIFMCTTSTKEAIYPGTKGIFHEKIIHRTRGIISETTECNTIVDTHRQVLASACATYNDTVGNCTITQLGVGVSSNTPDSTTITTLVSLVKVALTSATMLSGGTSVRFNWVIGYGSANGMNIAEFGLFTKDNVMFSRKVRASSINKTSDLQITGDWTILF